MAKELSREAALDNLVQQIFDVGWREEPVHAKDCPACDVASEIAGTLAACWDPNENWAETTVGDGLPGDSVLDQATRVAAWVLHRRLLGVKPSGRRSGGVA
jgi:hypothetical protein